MDTIVTLRLSDPRGGEIRLRTCSALRMGKVAASEVQKRGVLRVR
jgi:hypothetical protein